MKSVGPVYLVLLMHISFQNFMGPNLSYFRSFVSSVGTILNMLIPILIAATIVVFFYGLFLYVFKRDKFAGEGGKGGGKNVMIAGLVSLFVMVSVWGIVVLAQQALGVQGNANVTFPQLPVPN